MQLASTQGVLYSCGKVNIYVPIQAVRTPTYIHELPPRIGSTKIRCFKQRIFAHPRFMRFLSLL